jgi:hypothetical protein
MRANRVARTPGNQVLYTIVAFSPWTRPHGTTYGVVSRSLGRPGTLVVVALDVAVVAVTFAVMVMAARPLPTQTRFLLELSSHMVRGFHPQLVRNTARQLFR